jgi:hypothetical protein
MLFFASSTHVLPGAVADTFNDRIQVFDTGGHAVDVFGSRGKEPGELMRPGGLALDTLRVHLFVADSLNNRAQRWLVRDIPPEDHIRPRAEVISPFDFAPVHVGSDVEISGRAVDAYFKKYVISVTGQAGTVVLVNSDQPVWKGLLAVWQTSGLAPGIYRINLVVEDLVGNTTEVERRVRLLEVTDSIAKALK